jgi:hypothetical protein
MPLKPEDRETCLKLFDHELGRKLDEDVSPGLVFDSPRSTPCIRGKPPQADDSLPTPPEASADPILVKEKTRATLAVANVRKEEVVLFTVDDKGELTFVQKLPHGEAIDLETTKGQRWVAVFLSDPYRESFTVTGEKATWLIRSTAPVVTPCLGPPTPITSLKPRR